MSEEVLSTNTEPVPEETGSHPSRKADFKRVCTKLGLMMIAIFVFRGVATILLSLMAPLLETLNATMSYVVETAISLVFLYVFPLGFTIWLFREPKKETRERIYSKPVYFGDAMGMFPALYGVSILTNVLTMLISMLFTDADLNKSFNTVNELKADNMTCAVILFIQLAVIAPIVEEFWFRGIVMESLRPFGNGFAIFVSALLFGMTHANFQQFFYATALGICLGYIAQATKSIVTTTVMHAMFNSISGILLMFVSAEEVGDYLLSTVTGEKPEMTPIVTAYTVYLVFIMLLMAVGILMLLFKLRKIKRYRVPKGWTELTSGQRWGEFFSRASVIVMLLLAADTFTFRFIPTLLYKLISGE